MNWYKKAQQNIDIVQSGLEGLRAEARKYNSFEEFEKAWLLQIKHGLYWHITYDPNFYINPEKGPTDTSSFSQGKISKGKLMITSDLETWAESYTDNDLTGGEPRGYAAAIDMSNVPSNEYYQVNRGFGNEFFVNDPSSAKVLTVLPIDEALKMDAQYDNLKPQNKNELKKIYEQEHKFNNIEQSNDTEDNNELV